MQKKSYGKAVVNGELRYISASAITTFDPEQTGGCPRKWYFEKIVGKTKKDTVATETGSEVHEQNATYLKTGVDVLGVIARPGKHFMPEPGSDLIVEESFGDFEAALSTRDNILQGKVLPEAISPEEFTICLAGIPVMGAIDVRHKRGHWIDNEGERREDPANTVEVIDWKTTSDISKYAKLAGELIHTVQMPLYGAAVLREYPDAEWIRLSHGYFGTRQREAKKISALIPGDKIVSRVEEIENIVVRMIQTAKYKEVREVECQLESCQVYRGCPHKEYCPELPKRSIFDVLGIQPRSENMSVFGTKKPSEAKPAEQAIEAPAAAGPSSGMRSLFKKVTKGDEKHEAPVASVSKPVDDAARKAAIEAEKAKLKAEDEGRTVPEVIRCGKCNEALSPSNVSRLPDGNIIHIGCKATKPAINPPDAPKRDLTQTALPLDKQTIAEIEDKGLREKAAAHADACVAARPPEAKAAEKKGGRCTGGGDRVSLTPDALKSKKLVCPVCKKSVKYEITQEGEKLYGELASHNLPKEEEKPTDVPALVEERMSGTPTPSVASPTVAAPTIVMPTEAEIDSIVKQRINAVIAKGVTLYVDVYFEKTINLPTRLEDYYTPLVRDLEKQFNAADIRCAPSDSPLAFGKWKGALACMVRDNPPPVGSYVVRGVGQSEIAQVVVEALSPVCCEIVRGL